MKRNTQHLELETQQLEISSHYSGKVRAVTQTEILRIAAELMEADGLTGMLKYEPRWSKLSSIWLTFEFETRFGMHLRVKFENAWEAQMVGVDDETAKQPNHIYENRLEVRFQGSFMEGSFIEFQSRLAMATKVRDFVAILHAHLQEARVIIMDISTHED
jgi:hypothetical protein